jgi:hypothetical protein
MLLMEDVLISRGTATCWSTTCSSTARDQDMKERGHICAWRHICADTYVSSLLHTTIYVFYVCVCVCPHTAYDICVLILQNKYRWSRSHEWRKPAPDSGRARRSRRAQWRGTKDAYIVVLYGAEDTYVVVLTPTHMYNTHTRAREHTHTHTHTCTIDQGKSTLLSAAAGRLPVKGKVLVRPGIY